MTAMHPIKASLNTVPPHRCSHYLLLFIYLLLPPHRRSHYLFIYLFIYLLLLPPHCRSNYENHNAKLDAVAVYVAITVTMPV